MSGSRAEDEAAIMTGSLRDKGAPVVMRNVLP